MRKLTTLLFACATLAVSSAYSSLQAMGPAPAPAAEKARMAPQTFAAMEAQYVQQMRQFDHALYSQFSKHEGNLFYSSYSLHTALLMATHGAREQTRKEMLQVLMPGMSLDQAAGRGVVQGLTKVLNTPSKDYTLASANRMWVQKNFVLLPTYTTDLEKIWSVGAEAMDVSDPQKTADTINAWVEANTNKKIIRLILPEMIKVNTRVVLTNAVYFKGTWATQFDPKQTQEMDFAAPGGAVKVPMMYLKSPQVRYGEIVANPAESADKPGSGRSALAGTKIIELDYAGNSLAMRLTLPPEALKLEELNTTQMEIISAQPLEAKEVNVWMPKLKVEGSFPMIPILENMGIKQAFTLDADFSGITGKPDLYISVVVQKTFLEVNEEGSEAAAATAVILSTKSAPMSQTFRADRPYLLQIIHRPTGAVLFSGRIVKPTA